MEINYDAAIKVLTISSEGVVCNAFSAKPFPRFSIYTIRANRIGISVRRRSHYLNDSHNIPGEFTLEAVSKYIADLIFCEPVFISDQLLETEIWYARGYVNKLKNYPPEIFEKIPIEKFLGGGVKSYKNWMEKLVYSDRVFKNIPYEKIEWLIKRKIYPEKIHSIKNWTKVPFDHLLLAIRSKAWNNKNWGVFTSQYYDFYSPILTHHQEAWDDMDGFMKAALRFPKTEPVRAAFDRLFNCGGTLSQTLRCMTQRQLVSYCAALVERIKDKPIQQTLYKYQPPEIPLPDGWKLANKDTFWNLGTLFHCCINQNSRYSNGLKNQSAVVAYRDNFDNTPENVGALLFIERDEKKHMWEITELRGIDNLMVDNASMQAAQSITDELTKLEKRRERENDERRNSKQYDADLRSRARNGNFRGR